MLCAMGCAGMDKKMKTKVIAFNKRNGLIQEGDKIIVGVSGGKDSVCLLHVLNELRPELHLELLVVHVNHQIRGEVAVQDGEFVRKMAERMGLPCRIETIDVRELARVKRISEEEAGRLARYETMEMARLENGFDKIAVAHHQDDVAETVLFNLIRGTGPKGLSGIPPRRDYLIRPILFAESEDIAHYIEENHLTYREDSTNLETNYTRNKIRLKVFPYLEEEINARAKVHVAEAARRIAMQNEYIESVAKKEYVRVVKLEGTEYTYETAEFAALEPVIQVELIRLILKNLIANAKDVDGTHYQMIFELTDKEVGKRINLPEGIVVERTYEGVRFYEELQPDTEDTEFCVQCQPPCTQLGTYDGECYRIRMEIHENWRELGEIPQKDYTKWFDYDKIENNIFLRNPREGDYLTINTMGKKKKLSRYFIDEKVPASLRGQELVLADGSHIIWVLSGRISEEYKITDQTKRVLIITKERI